MKSFVMAALLCVMTSSAFAGGVVSGQISVSLTILPNQGCSNQVCAIDSQKLTENMKNSKSSDNFAVSKKDNVVTVTF